VKKKLILLVILAVPILLYMNVWQAFRYRVVETEIDLLEEKQQDWIEKNKKIIVGIEVLGAPERIDTLASEIEGLGKTDLPVAIRIKIDEPKGGDSG